VFHSVISDASFHKKYEAQRWINTALVGSCTFQTKINAHMCVRVT